MLEVGEGIAEIIPQLPGTAPFIVSTSNHIDEKSRESREL